MKRILLVDDEAHVLRVIKLNLERNGFDVETALSAEDALTMLRDNVVNSGFDVVITDVDMPVMNGCELAEMIHRVYGSESPMVFLVGDEVSEPVPDNLKSDKHTEFVEKPMSLRWLVSRINDYFGNFDSAAVPTTG